MSKSTYTEQAENLSKAIDIAIDCINLYAPKEWSKEQIEQFIFFYNENKKMALHPEPKFRRVSSLKCVVNDMFMYFQESTGDLVDHFWQQIKKNDLPYKRENKIDKIIKRKKIKDHIEYDLVIDSIVAYRQLNLITEGDVILLNQLLAQFEELNAGK